MIKSFRNINVRKDNYQGQYILYQSSEDLELHYKDYIEDILLGLALQGAYLIPDFPKFRAHHNKVFMEILRDMCPSPVIKNVVSWGYGTLEDFKKDLHQLPVELVIKPASGARSLGVRLVRGSAAQLRCARRISRSVSFMEWVKNIINNMIQKNYREKSIHRRKFVVQELIPGLAGDYKILVYGEKYYGLYRENRKKDFRASGSGKFYYRKDLPEGLLDFAEQVIKIFDVPFISLDIAFSQGKFYLIEFQFISFGNYTLEKSSHYFARRNGKWVCTEEQPNLEREFVRSVVKYIETRNDSIRNFRPMYPMA